MKSLKVFEHQEIFESSKDYKNIIPKLQNYYGSKGVPYFKLLSKGVKFRHYVGVIQIGNHIIEVLPKIDEGDDKTETWQKILIEMLKAVGFFKISSTSESTLRIKPNSILDLYFEYFINEVNYLIHRGLIKKYRKTEGNSFALKGSLHFPKHIQKNIVHKERFYVRYQTYDNEHIFHKIIFKTLKLLKLINTNPLLSDRIAELLLFFPEMPDLKITEKTFDTLVYSHKTECYRKAIDIARLILLNYHPDIISGRNNVLAIMFDMNRLWEKFVYVSLRKYFNNIQFQKTELFWNSDKYSSKLEPDIIIYDNDNKKPKLIIDTKWKNINGSKPSTEDLRQIFAYLEFWKTDKGILLYPCSQNKEPIDGQYQNNKNKECTLVFISLPVNDNINEKDIKKKIISVWQDKIYKDINEYVK